MGRLPRPKNREAEAPLLSGFSFERFRIDQIDTGRGRMVRSG